MAARAIRALLRECRGPVLGLLPALALPVGAWAHSLDVATFEVEVSAEGAALHASLATAAVDAELRRTLGEAAVAALHADDGRGWETAAVRLVRSCVGLAADGEAVRFGGGGIQAGSHQTEIVLALAGLDTHTRELALEVDCFSASPGQNNVVRWIRPDAEGRLVMTHQVLRASGGFRGVLGG